MASIHPETEAGGAYALETTTQSTKRDGNGHNINEAPRQVPVLLHENSVSKLDRIKAYDKTLKDRQQRELRYLKCSNRLASLTIRSKWYGIFSLFLALFAMFVDEIGILFVPKSHDMLVDILMLVALAAFTLDIVVLSITHKDYLFSSFFWLDVISTLSIVPDVALLSSWMVAMIDDASTESVTATGEEDDHSGNTHDTISITRFAAGAARAGSRASRSLRILRLIKMIRFIRLFKLFKVIKLRGSFATHNMEQQQKVTFGRSLADSGVQKVIIAVLAVLIAFPLLESSMQSATPYEEYGLDQLYILASEEPGGLNSTAYTRQLREYVDYDNEMSTVIYLMVRGKIEVSNLNRIRQLRYTEMFAFHRSKDTYVNFDIRRIVLSAAKYSVMKTGILILIIGLVRYFMGREANRNVIQPIERLLNTMQSLSLDSLLSERTRTKPDDGADEKSSASSRAKRSVSMILRSMNREQQSGSFKLNSTIDMYSSVLQRTDQYLKAMIPPTILKRLQTGEHTFFSTYRHVGVLAVEIDRFHEATNHLGSTALGAILSALHRRIDHCVRDVPSCWLARVDGVSRFIILCGCPDPVAAPVKQVFDVANRLLDLATNPIIPSVPSTARLARATTLEKEGVVRGSSILRTGVRLVKALISPRPERPPPQPTAISLNKANSESSILNSELLDLRCGIDVGVMHGGIFSRDIVRFVLSGQAMDSSLSLCAHARPNEILVSDQAMTELRDSCSSQTTEFILDYGSVRKRQASSDNSPLNSNSMVQHVQNRERWATKSMKTSNYDITSNSNESGAAQINAVLNRQKSASHLVGNVQEDVDAETESASNGVFDLILGRPATEAKVHGFEK